MPRGPNQHILLISWEAERNQFVEADYLLCSKCKAAIHFVYFNHRSERSCPANIY